MAAFVIGDGALLVRRDHLTALLQTADHTFDGVFQVVGSYYLAEDACGVQCCFVADISDVRSYSVPK